MATKSTDLKKELYPSQDECCPVFIKYFEGYNYREIAEALNLPLTTVKERLKTHKRRLRVSLKLFARHFRAAMQEL
ncbi:sigma factor-like helix-turn-helix DNA-binding protein [Pedobacter heparinus]|uniref:sigma factor-like helix-turn-helix DNA-binding protein n=1 Tax=Pedobacter heparinus TaxID=984 RepID=UPI00019EE128|nr:sigma factor-like helix-turn-helix DNA-binding protein [Pedobacter heparinus]